MNKVLVEAMTWLGTPYHHHGRVKGAGVDCATFLCEVYEAVGLITHIDPGTYSTDWHLHRSEEKYLSWLEKFGTLIESPNPGDVAIWKIGRCFRQGAIVIDSKSIIHSYISQGVVLDSIQKFGNREVKFFKVGQA